MKSYLCKTTYYKSKGNKEEIQYEDYIDFEAMKDKILVDDESTINYKEKSDPLKKMGIDVSNKKSIAQIQLEVLDKLQNKEINQTLKMDFGKDTVTEGLLNELDNAKIKTKVQEKQVQQNL